MAHADNADRVNVTFPILKYDTTDDGDLLVYGKATDASIDSDDQIVDADWSAKALEEWLKTGGNVRVQHSPYLYPAGKGVEITTSGDGHYVKALVVEPTAKQLVKKGVLTAYSVGIGRPQIVRDTAAKGGRIVGGKLIEISLVDRPANSNCGFTIAKSADGAVVDAEETFGDIAAALAAVEEKVDSAVSPAADFASMLADGVKAGVAAGTEAVQKMSELSQADLLKSWSEDREGFLRSMPPLEGDGTVTPEWQDWKAEKDAFYDGSEESRSLWAAKRDFDSHVGGGVDRDKIPAEDFAGPGRSFPIVTPGDVSDAASSLGRAKGNRDAIKNNIIRIARRKGPNFVAELPDTWKDGDGDKSVESSEIEKAGAKKCPKCGKNFHADSKLRNCDKCGADLPNGDSADKGADTAYAQALRPDGGKPPFRDGDNNADHPHPAHTNAAGDDDGDGVKPTATIDNNADATVGPHSGTNDVLESGGGVGYPGADGGVKKSELPYTLKRLHDITCGVYSDDSLRREYASLKSWADAVNVDAVRAEFGDDLAALAESVKSADPDLLADARAQLHKSFTDMYPNTSVSPGSIEPGRFRRGYLSGGHYRQNASGSDSGARIPDSNRTAEPGDFDRSELTAGHQRPSPGASGDNATKGVDGSVSPPSNFGAASAAYTRNQMQSIHDHISERRPEVCGFSQKQTDMPADMQANAKLTPVTANAPDGPKSADADYIKALVDSAVTEKSAYYEDVIAKLQTEIAELGAQPDPAQAPVRGVVAKSAGGGNAPVEKSAAEQERESEAEALMKYAAKFQFDGNPGMRELADKVMTKLQSGD